MQVNNKTGLYGDLYSLPLDVLITTDAADVTGLTAGLLFFYPQNPETSPRFWGCLYRGRRPRWCL